MGILNITPDSFFDGGKYFSTALAVLVKHASAHAKKLINAGADIIDIGGESSGPGSVNVPLEEELCRIIPVIRAFRKSHDPKLRKIWISVDTYKAEVARQAFNAGANMINDVTALRGDPEMPHILVKTEMPLILIYSKDSTARTTKKKTKYKNVMRSVSNFLRERTRFALKCGIKRENIIIDPGMGAFVSAVPKYSFEILQQLHKLKKLGYPICVGPSMKSFLGGNIKDRGIPSIFAAWYAMQNGANIVRTHNPVPLLSAAE